MQNFEAGEGPQDERGTDISIVSAETLLNIQGGSVPKLWDPFFNKVGIVMISGSSDTGKSTLLKQLCAAIVSGKDSFLGCRLNAIHKRAIYVSTEDMPLDIKATLQKTRAQFDPVESARRLDFVFDFASMNISALERRIESSPVDILVVDVWSDSFQGNPNDFVQVRNSMKKFKSIAHKHEMLIVLVHHSVKNAEKQAPDKSLLNGSQALEAAPRCVVELRMGSSPNERLLTVTKANYLGARFKNTSMVLEFDESTLTFRNVGERGRNEGHTRTFFADDKEVVELFLRLKSEGSSFEKCRELLVKKFTENRVPGLTWLKNHFNEVNRQSK